ncbi:MAG: tetratricopeptide repeat protein [Candidatus Brevundimonas phytovorans]|nr:tetratricopeptide repeat protein [Brevundimonas sp.]WEK57124.1 MAG: tetratricopeptide repeat protein [Brevundimonas sp.]
MLFNQITSSQRRRSRPGLAAVLAAALATAAPAHAEWRKAESDRFIVYSDVGDRQLRDFVQELESYDRVLRYRMGLPGDTPTLRKLPIYLVASSAELAKVRPGASSSLAGFYSASGEDIFGVAIRDRNVDTLKHEYAHHFMMHNFSYAYPGWFVEGFAEYYATVEIKADRFTVGRFNENRAAWLMSAPWMEMKDLLSRRPQERAANGETYYPLAWLLTHWFMSNPERQKMLSAYLLDVGAGGDSVEAMERATGLNMIRLRDTLRRYATGNLSFQIVTAAIPAAPVTITSMPESADDLLLLNQRLKLGVPADLRPATAAEVRRLAARYPDDPLALLALGHAELHFGDPAAAEAPLQRLLTLEPGHVEALQYLARARVAAIQDVEDPDEADRLAAEARAFLVRAHRQDDLNYITLMLAARNRRSDAGYPNDNDIAVLDQAFALAPQLSEARYDLANALVMRGRNAEAIALLEPLANHPHGSSGAVRALLAKARGEEPAEEDVDAASAEETS